MEHSWEELTALTRGRAFLVERVRLPDSGMAVEGRFQTPPVALLTPDDQAFVTAFVHCHGSIKQMEEWFGISYPTVKNRLKAIAQRLPMVEHLQATDHAATDASRSAVLARLERGEITAAEAAAALRGSR
ncbi:MAG: DUF2089 family protein [Planctomycetota bacterium]